MSSRTSTRQAAASSPPRNQQAARMRNMRSRSASVDLGAEIQGRRRTRQGSAGSAASNASISKGKGKRKGKGVKASGPDLSILNEELEEEPTEQSEPGSDDIEELDNYDFEDLDSLRDDTSQIAGSKESQLKADEFKRNARKLVETRRAANKSSPIDNDTLSSPSPSPSPQPESSPIPAQASSSRDNEGDAVPGATTEDILSTWQQSTRENNKENTKPTQKVQPSRRQQKRPFVPDDEEEEEDSFQTDTRIVPARVARPAARPAKRIRAEASDSSNDQPRRRREASKPAETVAEQEEARSQPMSTLVKAAAKANVQKATLNTRQTQSRKKWSDHDEAELIRLIGEFGCSWAKLAVMGDWETTDRPNFPVQLKDKARNIKVSYLKSGTDLPENFDQVKLGKKEVEAVQKVFPDYERD